MNDAQVVALWLSEEVLAATRLEAWRTLLAALSGGMTVRLLDLRPTPPPPPDLDALPAPELRLLDALATAGVPWERPTPEELGRALGAASSIVALASPRRPGSPPLLAVDAALLASAPATLAARLRAAGQVQSPGRARSASRH